MTRQVRDKCHCGRYDIAQWARGVFTLSESHLREKCTNDIAHADILSGDEVFCHAGSMHGKTFTVAHSDEDKNPYTDKHDPTRRDAWDEGYETASERFSLALAASQAECAELREALRSGWCHNCTYERGYAEHVSALLSRSPGSMDALREVVTRAIHATTQEIQRGLYIRTQGARAEACMRSLNVATIADRIIGPAKPADKKGGR